MEKGVIYVDGELSSRSSVVSLCHWWPVACCWSKNSAVVQATLGYRTKAHRVSRCALMHCNQKLLFLLC